jgi:hypothetical protein
MSGACHSNSVVYRCHTYMRCCRRCERLFRVKSGVGALRPKTGILCPDCRVVGTIDYYFLGFVEVNA